MTWELAPSGVRAAQALSAVAHVHAGAHPASVSGWLLIVLAVLVAAGWWAWHAWRHPWGPCPRCDGGGRNAGSTGRRFGDCKRCGGTGRHLRVSARVVHKGIERRRG